MNIIEGHLKRHQEAIELLCEASFQENIRELGQCWIDTLRSGNKIMLCGNGGSAADAQHLATELAVRFRRDRCALAGLALTTDTSVLTAGANDYGFESVFSRQVDALGQAGDLLVGISTSGGSANVVAAMKAAAEKGLQTMAFCGQKRGAVTEGAKFVFAAPSEETARIQECHLLVGHILCDLVEEEFVEA